MAFKEAQAQTSKYIDVPVWNAKGALVEGDSIEGYYIDREEFTTKYGDMVVVIIKDKDGNFHKLAGQSDIKNKFTSMPKGVKTRVTYVGLIETPRGAKKGYKVEYDEEDKIEA